MSNPQIFSLLRRIFFTFFVILIYRIGVHIPLPCGSIEVEKVLLFLKTFTLFSNTALSRKSIFSLSIMPYIVASIVNQLLFSEEKECNSDGMDSKNKFRIKIMTMFIAFLQAFFLISSSISFQNFFSINVFIDLVSLIAGSLVLMWLGELITLHGIGNGTSLIIFTGIIAEIPSNVVRIFNELMHSSITIEQFIFSLLIVVALTYFIVLVESSTRNISVNYTKQKPGIKIIHTTKSYIPLKVNTAGVIPPIFANAILMLPLTILNIYRTKYAFVDIVANYFLPGKLLYELLYMALIVFFCFFYTFIVFDPNKAADNLKKSGGVIFGYRPGKDTSVFLHNVINKLTIVGAAYISVVCMSTEIMKITNIPSFILNGTSLLIVVGVIVDTLSQIQMYIFSGQYNKALQKTGLRRRSI